MDFIKQVMYQVLITLMPIEYSSMIYIIEAFTLNFRFWNGTRLMVFQKKKSFKFFFLYLIKKKGLIYKLSSLGEDGEFIYRDYNENIILEHVSDRKKKILVRGTDIVDVSI